MKKNFTICLLLLVLSTSCKKVLDTVPNGALVPLTSYASVTQINAALSGIYYNLRSASMYSKFYTGYMVHGTDETYFYNTNYGYNTYAYINGSTDGDIRNFWAACYQAINYCNTLLDNIDASAATGNVDAAIVRKAKGETLFLRSYYYFLLAQWFGDVPLQLHASSDPSDGQIARTPVKVVYDQIITDMTAAEAMLTDQTFASFGYSERVSVTAVEGVLARVCLYAAGAPVNDTKRYADALKWAQKVVDGKQHSLVPSYQQVFTDEMQNKYNKENMWEIGFNQFASGVTSAGGQFSVYMNIGKSTGTAVNGLTTYDGYCYGYIKLYARLYAQYQANDLRRDWNCSNYGWNGLTKSYYTASQIWSRQPAKWNREYEPDGSRLTQTSSGTNFPVLRYSDVLLMLAEAENEVNGPTAIAYDAINQVRRRAYSATPVINNFTITRAGSGYTAAPAITLSSGTATAFSSLVSGTVSQISLITNGSYTSAPTVYIGTPWAANTAYALNAQITNNGFVYTVTKAGTATTIAPTNSSGASNPVTTGATFTYAGVQATAAVNLTPAGGADVAAGLSKASFRLALQKERSLELCFEALRKSDLRRWGILIPTVQSLFADVTAGSSNPAYNVSFPPILTEITAVGSDITPSTPPQNIGAKDIFWPIPQNEILYNRKITQNPGF